MDDRAAKLALARKKLKDHQEKKLQDSNVKESSNNQLYISQTVSEISDTNTVLQNTVKNIDDVVTVSNNQPNITEVKDINAAEILISNKRNLELQNIELQTKLSEVERNLITTTQHYNKSCKRIESLEINLQNIQQQYNEAIVQLTSRDSLIVELQNTTKLLSEEKNNIIEQFEFTKSILSAKEIENESLNSQMINIQNELDSLKLQLQQLTSGVQINQNSNSNEDIRHENEILLQKVSSLEQQLKNQLREYQQINIHYENYVEELNNQIKSLTKKNEELYKEINNLSNRESSLIEQISDMEIRLQNYSKVDTSKVVEHDTELNEIHEKLMIAQEKLQSMQIENEKLQKLYDESRVKLEESKETVCEHNEVPNILKLNAEITSDKVALQRATEQNKKMKQDFQGLEDAFVKMTKDKLELTEKVTAEKFLNRELTIKLAELDEKAKDMYKTLKAKDEEMIRLQASYRDLETKYRQLESKLCNGDNANVETQPKPEIETEFKAKEEQCDTIPESHTIECDNRKRNDLCKDDAMQKLQDRFLKIMGEVADLSDEKHRLEHIITQLQNETETICEYVALYQQQRSLLKKRDEERSAQIKMFQTECKRLQSHLDELTGILKRFADDKELVSYFQNQSKHDDLKRVMTLLSNLKTNYLVDPHKTVDFNNFYPCNCCSGQLIEV